MVRAGSISTLEREATITALEQGSFDLVLIGGGITGAGTAREAAARGLSVALLEAGDWAIGTSSRSSKLIHGGLRYLAMGDVALVRETALERTQILRIAPHLAEPRWMVLPCRNRATLLKFRAAIQVYETLGSVASADRHRNWSSEDLAREEPLIGRDAHPWACAYREYLTDDARLVLANLRGAVGLGALALSYAPVEEILLEDGRAAAVRVRCARSGREFRVRGRCVVNAAGPWVEAVRRLDEPDAPDWLHLSKGVHVAVAAEKLPIHHIVVMNTKDRRTIFAIPRGQVTYLGTTDTSYRRGPEPWPPVQRADVEYLLQPVTRYFDTAPLAVDDVVGAWAGLRPLVAEPGKLASEISRKDEILIGSHGVVSIAGGKLTGYRLMAVSVLGKVAEVLGQTLPDADPDDELPGGDFDGDLDGLAEKLVQGSGAPHDAARPLARLYGTEAQRVLALGAEPLVPGARLLAGEVDWAVCEEGAVTVEDVLYRRNRSAYWAPAVAREAVEPVARRMAGLLGWPDERVREEVSATRARLARDLEFDGPGE
jgi:glycerol-3-phosphate dehydrogenase